MKIIKSLSNGLAFIESLIVILLLSFMIILSFTQVILRNIFDSGIIWLDPFLRHLVLWIGFLGASLATRNDKHIAIDLVSRFASQKQKRIIRIITSLFAASVCIFLTNAGLTFLKHEIVTNSILFTIESIQFRAWWFQTIIPFGFALISFRFILYLIELLFSNKISFLNSQPHSISTQGEN